jgi:hypothetical protein
MAEPATACDRDVMTETPEQNKILAEAQAAAGHLGPAADELDEAAYKVPLAVDPAADGQDAFPFANSSHKNVVKPSGLVVGDLAEEGEAQAPMDS